MHHDTLDETATREAVIEAASSVTSGDVVRFNDRASTATVTDVNDYGDSSLNARYVTLEADTDAETVYRVQHDYGDDGVRFQQRRGFDDDGRAIWNDFTLDSLEVVQSHRFRKGNVYRDVDESTTHYMTVVDRDPVGGRYTTFRSVLVNGDSGKVYRNDETDRASHRFKEDIFAGEYELAAEIRENDEYHDAERDEVLRVSWIAAESVALMDDANEVVRRLKFHEFVDELGDRLTDVDGNGDDGDDGDEWNPEPAELRDDEGDLDAHARRNLEMLRKADEGEGDDDPEVRCDGGQTESQEVGFVRAVAVGMVPPSLVDAIRGGCEGVVREDGAIVLDDVDGVHLKLKDASEIEAGTDVYVARLRGAEWCKPLDEHERDQKQKEAERRLKEWERDREKDRAREEAEAFWSEYDIPFDYDVAIKGRRSGLLRGSSGTGRSSQTVEHLYVLEAFEAGRLKRQADRYLCSDEAKFRFDEGERRTDSDGETFIPPVTCQSCLDFMDRWTVDSDGGSR